uniref:Uncharacterized protein n=1 Tax=Schistosoma curassoni TaxID=6186 RepID=A0A183JIH5_9TREM
MQPSLLQNPLGSTREWNTRRTSLRPTGKMMRVSVWATPSSTQDTLVFCSPILITQAVGKPMPVAQTLA